MSLPDFDGHKADIQADPMRSAIIESLHAAVALCDGKYAVARIDEQAPIATDDDLALHESAAVDLIDSHGRIRGVWSVAGGTLNHSQVMAIGRQLVTIIDLNDAARRWKWELEKIRPLTDQALVAIYSIHNGRFSYVNSKFAETLGYSREERLSLSSFDELAVEEERSRVRDMVRSRLDGEVRHVRYVTKGRARDGRIVDAEIHGSVAVIEGGRMGIGTAFDVTAQLASQKQLREREEF